VLAAVIMAILGVPAGLVLDRLALTLAWPPGAADEDEPAPQEHGAGALAVNAALGSEGGQVLVRSPYSWRTLAVVAATVTVFAAVGARFESAGDRAIVAACASVFVLCSTTDLMSYRVPNVVTYPAILAALLIGLVAPHASPADVLAGGLLAGGLLFVPALLTSSMGMGDAKLALFAGLALGLRAVVPALLLMAISGGIVAAALLLFRLRPRGAPMPYAPFIAFGAVVTLLLQGPAAAPLV
jgi:leader peptidase (prepilin peptidase)/N-methyltransferase